MSAAAPLAPALPSVPVMPPSATPPRPAVVPASPKPFRWTTEMFHAVSDSGAFEGRNVILVNGEVLEMPAPGPAHTTAATLGLHALSAVFRDGFVVRHQDGLPLGLAVDPVPDLAVVAGSVRQFAAAHPRTAILVVEIADSSLAYDRGEKSNLYAAAGIPEYWVVDLVNRQLVVFRDPRPDPALPFGAGYARVAEVPEAESVAPLAAAGSPVRVADLLP